MQTALSEISAEDDLISRIGERVRLGRRARRLSRRALAAAALVSERSLASLEAGQGNISIGLLSRVAEALELDLETLIAAEPLEAGARRFASRYQAASPAARQRAEAALAAGFEKAARVCLIGLRGAGKSTLGAMSAAKLNMPFIELGDEIERLAGLPVAEVIALYGQDGYRELEHRALVETTAAHDRAILAVAGGIVEAPETYRLLLERFHTVWLKAAPEDHMARVRGQGDERPMAGHPRAMDELRQILERRTAHYGQAEIVVETSGRTPEVAAAALAKVVEVATGALVENATAVTSI